VAKPYKQLLVGDGQRVWIFDEDLNQVIVRRLGEALGSTPAALLAGNQDVERAFTWKELPFADGLDGSRRRRSRRRRRSPRSLGFDFKGLAALELVDAFGQKSVVRFTSLERTRSSRPRRSRSRRRRART
jgi:outer membrane lipoprotein carrier protein